MKNSRINIYYYSIALFIFLALASVKTFSQEYVVKHISKAFSANSSTELNINTKYGNVDIRDWKKNEIKIDVKIIIRGLSSQKTDQVLKNININIYNEGNIIYAQTQFDDAFFKIIDKNYPRDDKNFEINYIINMPSNVKLSLKNKYGNIFINKLESKSIITLKYGSLQANQFLSSGKEKITEINLGYSNATIESCKWLKLNIKYSKLNIQDSKALIIMSKYSEVNIEKNSSVVCESKYDTYRIGTLSNFVTEAKFSNFKFDELKKKLLINTKYTDIRIKYIPPSFKSIEIENSYGSIGIGIDAKASYKIKGYAKYAEIHYPSNSRVIKSQENTEFNVRGVIGKENASDSYVKIETLYGSINLIK